MSKTSNKNGLTVKNVPFCGTKLLAVQEKDSGKIYVGINSILRELGFDDRQIEYRRNKWNADKVLCKGVQKFSYPSQDGGTQETYCMEIKKLPLALTKIEITPKMENEMPELSGKLEKYQDECADVLAAAFLPETYDNTNGNGNTPSNSDSVYSESASSESAHFPNKPQALDFHNTPVITTSELAKHYGIPYQNVLTIFYRHKEQFDKGIHYFLLEMDEEIELRKMNGLNTATKLYLWTRKGSLMFTKIINNGVGWEQYKKLLDILFQKTYGDNIENSGKDIVAGTDGIQQSLAICEKQLKPQNNWYLKNSYKIERICKALDIKVKEFNHLVIAKIQEKYDMTFIGELYKNKNGSTPEYALDIINYFPELSEIADNVLYEFMLSIIDRFTLVKDISSIK